MSIIIANPGTFCLCCNFSFVASALAEIEKCVSKSHVALSLAQVSGHSLGVLCQAFILGRRALRFDLSFLLEFFCAQ